MKFALATFCLVAGAVATTVLLWATSLPLGIPDEWEWTRLPADADTPLNLLLAAAGAVLYLTVVWLGGTRLVTAGVTRAEAALWVVVLFIAAFGWLWCVQETGPPAASLGKAPFVLYYPGASGYFTHARYEAPDVHRFLSEYEGLMRQGDVLHIGTHPPGLFCTFYGLIGLIDNAPGLAEWLDSTEPESVRESLAVIARNSALTSHRLTSHDGTVLWLAMLLAQSLAAATVIPLYGLLRWTLDRPAAFVAAAFWPAVPAVAIFLPKSDAAYPFLAAALVWLSLSMWRQPRLITGVCAGFIAWVGLFCSLAFLPILAFAVAVWATDLLQARGMIRSNQCAAVIAALVGFFAPIVALWATMGLNQFVVWWWNYHNHAGFYAQFPRTYVWWLAVNPLELSIAVGWPLMAAALWTATCWLKPGFSESGDSLSDDREARLSAKPGFFRRRRALLIGGGVWLLLWISGKNSGEAARLWLLLMPGVVWLAAHVNGAKPAHSFGRTGTPVWRLLGILAASLAVCILTVHRVGGFHLQ